MIDITNDQVTEIVINILEKTCFLIADEIDMANVENYKSQITWSSKIVYSGTQSGTIYVDASDGFLQELASCILGMSPEEIDPSEDGVQANHEIANIIAGSIILGIGGDHDEYKLGLPEKGSIVHDGIAAECYLETSCGVVHVHWHPETNEMKQAA